MGGSRPEEAKPPISGQRRGPKSRQRGRGSWGGDSQPLPTIYGVWGTAVSSRGEVRGAATAAKRFSCVLAAPDHLSWNFLGQVLGEGGHGPLKSAYDQQGRPATASVAYNAAFTGQPSGVFVSLCLSV